MGFYHQNHDKTQIKVIVSKTDLIPEIAALLKSNKMWVSRDTHPLSKNPHQQADGPYIKIVGPAGSGKSTLASLICEEIRPEGFCLVNEDPNPPRHRDRFTGMAVDRIREKITVRVCMVKEEFQPPPSDIIEVLCHTVEKKTTTTAK